MSGNDDKTGVLCEQVSQAFHDRAPLAIRAGNSKSFYGRKVEGTELRLQGHEGILSYEPSELVLTARSGTPISHIEAALQEHGQQLGFEPPRHSEKSTIGGIIATGLSGPARPFFGSARDFVLGTKIVNGKGELMQFGGQVMKNVAGYDVSRLMVGAQGTLGLILAVSVKVLPGPEAETTLAFETDALNGHGMLRDWLGQGHPISASCHYRGVLTIRLSSTANSIETARKQIGGEVTGGDLWQQLRDQTHPCFRQANLWRLSLPPAAPVTDADDQLIEWGGALRWQVSNDELFAHARRLGGHATRYNISSGPADQVFEPLPAGMMALHKRIKLALDPAGVLNPARLYRAL